MKQLLSALVITFFYAPNVHAQSVNGIPLKDLDAEYVQISSEDKALTHKITIMADYGQERRTLAADKYTKIMDANGKAMTFNSIIDALNFMARYGYEVVQVYPAQDTARTPQYLLKRKKQ